MDDRFRFLRIDLQEKLIALVVALGLNHRIENGYLCTSEIDELVVEDLRSAVRTSVFEEWHLWRGGSAKNSALYHCYIAYMNNQAIDFVEEDDNGARWFLLSRKSDPYSWGVDAFVGR
jgi:hypothetical protein